MSRSHSDLPVDQRKLLCREWRRPLPRTTVENIGETDLSSGRAPSRKRHDDSQIQFVAIESSPPGAVAEDSQLLLTTRREVRDRQREETAITIHKICGRAQGRKVDIVNRGTVALHGKRRR